MKKKTKRAAKKDTSTPSTAPRLIASLIKWDNSFPCLEETYKIGTQKITTKRFYSLQSERVNHEEKFLYDVIRADNLPSFIKANLRKLKKLIEKEISHRDKVYEKISKEQAIAVQSYFQDEDYFMKDVNSEYFSNELEKVYVEYLKAYLDTKFYESMTRSRNLDRRELLAAHGITD